MSEGAPATRPGTDPRTGAVRRHHLDPSTIQRAVKGAVRAAGLTRVHVGLESGSDAVLELVRWDGADLPGYLGRWVNPGHMIEGGAFLIHEGRRQGREEWTRAGVDWIVIGIALDDMQDGGAYSGCYRTGGIADAFGAGDDGAAVGLRRARLCRLATAAGRPSRRGHGHGHVT